MPGKVVLLGGGGFVGRCIASRLSGRGFNVTVPTRRRNNRKELATELLPAVMDAKVPPGASASTRGLLTHLKEIGGR